MDTNNCQVLVATDWRYPARLSKEEGLALGGQPWELAWPDTECCYEMAREIVPRAWEILSLIEQALPEVLTTPQPSLHASVWEGMRDVFAYRAIVPLLARKQFIVEQAHQQEVAAVASRERVSNLHWWNGLAAVSEPAQAAADELDIGYQPGRSAAWYRLRHWLAGPLGTGKAIGELLRLDRPTRETLQHPDPDVMFLIYGPTVVRIVAAIAEALHNEQALSSLAVDFQPGGLNQQLQQAQIEHCLASSFIEPNLSRTAWSWLGRWPAIMRTYHRRTKELQLSEQIHEALLQAIELRLTYTLSAYLPRAVWRSRLAGAILDQIKPKSVVTMHLPGDGHAMNAMVVEAQKRGIPTVFVQHGIMGTRNAMTATLPYQRVLVFHQPAVELLEGKGAAAPAEIVGSPFYDDISQPAAGQRDEGYVLVASQPDEQIERRRSQYSWLRVLFAACKSLGREVILKVHPDDADNISYYQQLVDETDALVRIARHGEQPLSELMAGCSLFISRFSTTLLDAVLAGKPAIMVNFTGQPNPYPFPRRRAVAAAYTPQELSTKLRELLEDPEARAELSAARDDYIAYHIGPTDGQAAQRIAAALAECVEESN